MKKKSHTGDDHCSSWTEMITNPGRETVITIGQKQLIQWRFSDVIFLILEWRQPEQQDALLSRNWRIAQNDFCTISTCISCDSNTEDHFFPIIPSTGGS